MNAAHAPDQKIPLVDPAVATAQQRDLIERGANGRPFVPKVYATLANHPALMGPWMAFGSALLFKGTLPGRDRETLILRAARNCDAPYEWGQHVGWAQREGLTDAEIDAIGSGPTAPGLDEWGRLLVRAADELHRAARLSDATWTALAERYDDQQLLEACFAVGQYTMLAYALNSVGVTAEEGAPALGSSRPS